MGKHFQLSIPTPCHENWDKMTPVEKGRFCDSCKKQVIDFSLMNDRQIAEFFKKPSTGSVCGRFMTDQLDRNIEIPRKRIPWLKYLFHIAIPALLVSCREELKGKIKTVETEIAEDRNNQSDNYFVGMIMPEILPIDTAISRIVPLVKENIGKIEEEPKVDTVLLKEVVVCSNMRMGVIKRPWVIKDTAFTVVNQDTAQKQPLVLGGVIPGVKIQEDKSDSLIKKIASRTKGLYHKIFPNPVRSNATLRIEWKDSEIGEYSLQLFSFGGQLILRKEVWIDKEVGLLELQLPQVSAGTYLLRMTNKTSGRSFTEKIIVQ